MGSRKRFGVLCACLFFLVCMLCGSVTGAGGQGRLEGRTITGTAYAFSGRFAGRTAPVTLIINHLTSPADVQRLNSALQSGGQDELLRTVSGMNAGRIQIGNNVGVPANVIIATPQENGETKLTVLYQRNLRFSEVRYGTRSADYQFGYAEMYLGRNGQGQGMLVPAARIRLREGNNWEVEDFGVFPARLMGLQVRGGNRVR